MGNESSDLSVDDHLRIAVDLLNYGAWTLSQRADPTAIGHAITDAYYAALHAVSAYVLARHDERARSHADRDRWLRDRRFPEFTDQDRREYFGLKSASEAARYHGRIFTILDHTLLRQRAERLVAKWGDRAKRAPPA